MFGLLEWFFKLYTLWQNNIAMGSPPFEDASPIKHGGFPLPC